MEKLIVSSSPHIKKARTSKNIMIDVCIAMAPACIVGVLLFGINALIVLLISCASSVAFEFLYKFLEKKPFKQIVSEFDFTSLVTGMLIGMNMPPLVDWYIPIIASLFAIIVVKMIFGGTGKNIVNPAIAGRVFVFISFGIVASGAFIDPIGSLSNFTADQTALNSGATALGGLLGQDLSTMPSNMDMFLGIMAGTIGETSAAALLAGGVYLWVRGVINGVWPLTYIAVTGVVTVLLNGFDFAYFLPSILSGGLFLGAIFMATDYTTTPNSWQANIVYFVMLGVLTAVLRHTNKVEVVSFVILLMNLFVPMLDKYIVPKTFGFVAKKEAK